MYFYNSYDILHLLLFHVNQASEETKTELPRGMSEHDNSPWSARSNTTERCVFNYQYNRTRNFDNENDIGLVKFLYVAILGKTT